MEATLATLSAPQLVGWVRYFRAQEAREDRRLAAIGAAVLNAMGAEVEVEHVMGLMVQPVGPPPPRRERARSAPEHAQAPRKTQAVTVRTDADIASTLAHWFGPPV